jgi:biotin operon repressor
VVGWTWEQRLLLKKHYNEMPLEELMVLLDKDATSIYNQVYQLRKKGWKFNRVRDKKK